MGFFKNRDRSERRKNKAFHASGMRAARAAYDFPVPGRDKSWQAWDVYVEWVTSLGGTPVGLEAFLKELPRG